MTLAELLAKRAGFIEKMKALHDSNGTFTKEQQTEYDEHKAEIKKLDAQIERHKEMEKLRVETATPIKEQEAIAEPGEGGPSDVKVVSDSKPLTKGFVLGAAALCAGKAMQDGFRGSMAWASKKYGANHPVVKTLQAGSTPGSVLVPTDYSSEIIELLRDQTTIRGLATRHIGMPNGNITIPRHTGGTNAGYVGELVARDVTDINLDDIDLKAKKLMSVTSLSSEMLDDNAYGAEAFVRDDLVEGMAQKEDEQLIRGAKSATEPTSVKEIADDGSRTEAASDISALSGAALVQEIGDQLGVLELNLMEANVPCDDAIWLMAPRTWNFLKRLRDANGNKVYPEMAQMELDGYPFRVSNKIPKNLGGGTNESELYFLSPRQFIFGDVMDVELLATNVGSYQDGGNLKSTFANDSIAIRALARSDFAVRHPEGVYYLSGVKWGV
jgi:HK97 family phage major capsid protein